MQTRSELTLIRSFLDSDRRAIVTAILASIVSGASSALLIAFIGKQFVRTEPFGMQSIALFAVLLILSVATNLYASKVLIEASSEHSYSLRMALCRRIVSTGYERIEKIGSPRLIAMLSEDLTDVAVAFTRIPVLVTNSTRVFFCIVYLLWMTPLAMTLLLLLSLPVIYFQILLYRRAKVHLQVLLPIRDRRYSLYVMLTSGIKELLVDRLTRVGFFTNQLEENARKFKFAQQKSFMANQYAANWG
ncbi:MAG: hypothetical protein HKN43_05960, partial [Rhodothermales bacterium]|nr:hypothetical protein [Rhodothermales bacterium]